MNRTKTAATRLTAVLLGACMLVPPVFAADGCVQADGGLRLRESPGTSAAVLTTLPDKARVEVLAKTQDGWFQVSYNSLTGFVSADYLAVEQADLEGLEIFTVPVFGRVTEGPLNIRSGPGTSYEKTGKVSAGSVVELLETLDGWYRIDGGYLSAEYIVIVDAAEAASSGKGADVAAYAKQFLGSRYAYGGSSPSGFDCSGFVKYVYGQFGITLSRTASSQMDHGVSVSMSELQPGDLVFFLKKGSGASRASHVGIYIGGDQFIHASTSSTGVIISDMDSAYYTTGFVGGRRLL